MLLVLWSSQLHVVIQQSNFGRIVSNDIFTYARPWIAMGVEANTENARQ